MYISGSRRFPTECPVGQCPRCNDWASKWKPACAHRPERRWRPGRFSWNSAEGGGGGATGSSSSPIHVRLDPVAPPPPRHVLFSRYPHSDSLLGSGFRGGNGRIDVLQVSTCRGEEDHFGACTVVWGWGWGGVGILSFFARTVVCVALPQDKIPERRDW